MCEDLISQTDYIYVYVCVSSRPLVFNQVQYEVS